MTTRTIPYETHPRLAYVIVLAQLDWPRMPVEMMQVMDHQLAHEIFKTIAGIKKGQFEKYGNTGGDWYLALYDPEDGNEWEFKNFTRHGDWHTYDVRPSNAMRRRFLSSRELEGLDD